MNALKSGAIALALAGALSGCAPMPKIVPSEKVAAVLTGIGEPFQFKFEREPLDVADVVSRASALSFDLAVRLALAHDASVQAALARVRQAEAEAKQTRLLPNPILAVALRFPINGVGQPDVDASVAADLLSLVLRPGRIGAADERLRKSVAESLVTVLDVLAEIQQQYSKAQALAAQVKIDEARKGILGELLRVTEARVKGGEAAKLDVLTVQSQVASLETELTSRRSDERQARLTLAQLIGEPSSPATWVLDEWKAPAPVSDDEQKWIKLALGRRPELQAIVWELGALGQEMRVARLSTFVEGSEIGPTAERQGGDWSVGPAVSIGIPVFDFGQEQRALVAGRVVEQRHELTRVERQVVREVRGALQQLKASRAALGLVEQKLIPLQDDRLAQAKNSYRLGVADVLAVRLAEQDLQDARSQQVELQRQVSEASFQLTRAVGGVPPTDFANTESTSGTTNPESKQ